MAIQENLPDPTADVLPDETTEELAVSTPPEEADDGEPLRSMRIRIDGIRTDEMTIEERDRLRNALIDYLAGSLGHPISGVKFEDVR